MEQKIIKRSRRDKRKAKEKIERDQKNLLHEYTLVNHIFANALSFLIPFSKAMVIKFNGKFFLVVKKKDQIETHNINQGDYVFTNEKGETVELFDGMLVDVTDNDEKLNKKSKIIH